MLSDCVKLIYHMEIEYYDSENIFSLNGFILIIDNSIQKEEKNE